MRNKKIHYITNDYEHNHRVKVYNKYIKNEPKVSIEDADIIACGGGDGTLLKIINKYQHLKKPFWGVNAGTIGFLMNDDYPWKYKENEVKNKKLRLIKVTVTYTTSVRDLSSIYDKEIEVTKEFQAFNEVFIAELNGWINFECKDKNHILGTFKGSGLIISTAQGSTGMNKNNDGVVLPLSSKDWVITGDKTNENINYVLKPNPIKIKVSSRREVTLFVDGHNHVIKNVKEVLLEKGKTVQLLFGDYQSFKSNRR